jgi:hypothetical protein
MDNISVSYMGSFRIHNLIQKIDILMFSFFFSVHLGPFTLYVKVKTTATFVTGRGVPYGSATSRFPHFVHNWLTDGGEVVRPCAGPALPPARFLVLIYVRGRVKPVVIVRLEGLGQLKKISMTLSGIASPDLSACSEASTIMPRPCAP